MLAILTGHNTRLRADFEAQRALNYELAQLMVYAQHDPKNMPKYRPAGAAAVRSDEADQARLRGALIAMALQSRKRKET